MDSTHNQLFSENKLGEDQSFEPANNKAVAVSEYSSSDNCSLQSEKFKSDGFTQSQTPMVNSYCNCYSLRNRRLFDYVY